MPLAQHEYLKLVIRNLPPLLSAETFRNACNDEFGDRVRWSCFICGKESAKTTRTATGFVKVASSADVFDFKAAFEGRQFGTERSREHAPVTVEYAPLQRVPGAKVKRDPREGTIAQDAAFREFREALEKGPELLPSAALLPEPQQPDSKGQRIITPLMAHLADTTALEAKPPKPTSSRSVKSKKSQQQQQQQQATNVTAEAVRSQSSKKRQPKAQKTPSGTAAKDQSSMQAAPKSAASRTRESTAEETSLKASNPSSATTTKRARPPAKVSSKSSRSLPHASNATASPSRPSQTSSLDGQAAGFAAREAARHALSALATTSRTSSDSTEQASATAKATATAASDSAVHNTTDKGRDKPKKERRVRPGFGAWQRSRSNTDESRAGPS